VFSVELQFSPKTVETPTIKVHALRVSGKLTKQDMDLVAPPLEEKIRESGKVDLFCDMDKPSRTFR
jgi:hypothetical protein